MLREAVRIAIVHGVHAIAVHWGKVPMVRAPNMSKYVNEYSSLMGMYEQQR